MRSATTAWRPPSTSTSSGDGTASATAMFGKVMSQIKPRMAVGYHVFNDFDTKPRRSEKEVRLHIRRALRAGSRLHGVQRDQEGHPRPHGRL